MKINLAELDLITEKLYITIDRISVPGNNDAPSETTNKYFIKRQGNSFSAPISIHTFNQFCYRVQPVLVFVKSIEFARFSQITRIPPQFMGYSTALINNEVKIHNQNENDYEILSKLDISNEDDLFNLSLMYDLNIVEQIYVLYIMRERYNMKTILMYEDTLEHINRLYNTVSFNG